MSLIGLKINTSFVVLSGYLMWNTVKKVFLRIVNVRHFREDLIARIEQICLSKYWDYHVSQGI